MQSVTALLHMQIDIREILSFYRKQTSVYEIRKRWQPVFTIHISLKTKTNIETEIQSGQFLMEKVLDVTDIYFRMLRLHIWPGLSVRLYL